MKKLTNKLIQRGYTPSEIKETTNKIQFEEKAQLLTKQPKDNSQPPIILPTKLNDCHTDLISNNWETITNDKTLSEKLPTKPVIANK